MQRLLTAAFALVLVLGCTKAADTPGAGPPMARTGLEAAAADSTSLRRFEEVMDYARAEALHTRPLGEIMQAVGMYFAGTPYVAGMLDEPKQETLLVSLTGFDCVLLVETALALAWTIDAQTYSFQDFSDGIRRLRYRDGALQGYCSRLHYFSDWIANNEARGQVRNLTAQLGGVPLDKTLTFMGTHRDSYPQLAVSDSLYAGILAIERRLANLDLYYIPQDRIRTVYDQLQAGDIIATSTNIDGLDVSHTGLVYDVGDGEKGFLHASTSGGVKVSPDLQSYVENNRIQTGIIVARPQALR